MAKKINIALFGFGRIGRNLFRLGYNNPNYNFVAISDFGSAEALHYLLVRDSIHGSMDDEVILDGNHFVFATLHISLLKSHHFLTLESLSKFSKIKGESLSTAEYDIFPRNFFVFQKLFEFSGAHV